MHRRLPFPTKCCSTGNDSTGRNISLEIATQCIWAGKVLWQDGRNGPLLNLVLNVLTQALERSSLRSVCLIPFVKTNALVLSNIFFSYKRSDQDSCIRGKQKTISSFQSPFQMPEQKDMLSKQEQCHHQQTSPPSPTTHTLIKENQAKTK